MNGKDLLDAVGGVDEEVIEKSDSFTAKKRNLMRAGLIAAACLCIAAAGAIALHAAFAGNGSSVSQAALVTGTDGAGDGSLYIPKIELPEKTEEGVAMDMIGLLVYRGGIYTQTESFIGEDAERISPLIGEKLGHAKGTIDEWSSQDDYASEFASTFEGDVFAVNGYGTDFRVCISWEYTDENGVPNRWVEFLERLNDITLDTGADIFGERLNLRGRVTGAEFQTAHDWDYAIPDYHPLEAAPEQLDTFIDALYGGHFEDKTDEWLDAEFAMVDHSRHLILHLDDGTSVHLSLFEGGYVGYGGDGFYNHIGWNYLKISDEAFAPIWELCG